MKLKIGDIRIIRKFLFTRLTLLGCTRWLEFANIKQMYTTSRFGWVSIAFVDKDGAEL